jgi:hypothetical protein
MICHCRQNTAVKKDISRYWHEDDKQAQATNRTLPIPTQVTPDSNHPPVSPQKITFEMTSFTEVE